MFCTKCGFNAGDAKFCSKCGAPINKAQEQAQAVEQTPVAEQPAEQVVEPQIQFEVPPQQPQADYSQLQAGYSQAQAEYSQAGYSQPQQANVQPEFNQPQFNSMPYGTQPVNQMPPKKKKWPKIAAIVAAVLIILGVGGYFAAPYITEMISPKKQAVTALKSAGAEFQSAVTDTFSSLSAANVSTKNEVKGTFKVSNANVDGMNYMSYLKVDTVNYSIQSDVSKNAVSGTVGLASGSSANVINIQFYTDGSNVYFKIPELFEESFRISASDLELDTGVSGTLGSLGSLSSVLGTVDSAALAQYADVFEAAFKDIMTGFDTMVEKCVYNKTGSSKYQSENGDIKVNTFEVTLTKDALIAGINKAIDALYEDTAVSTYMNLITSLTGGSKDTLKSSVASGLSTMKDIPFTIYVNKSNEIVKVIMNLSAIDATMTGEVSIEFIGTDNPMDYVVMQAVVGGASMKYIVKTSGTTASFAMDVVPDQTTNSGEFLSVGAEFSNNGNKVDLGNLFIKGNMGDMTMDMTMSGTAEQSSFDTMSVTSSSFKNALDPYNMTTSQSTALSEELSKNMAVLKKVISDSLFSQLFYGM